MQKTFITFIITFAIGIYGLQAQNSSPFSFETTTHDFGRVKEDGGKISYTFKFKNNGKQPIIIKNVESSCGCTTPDWSRTPVLPGKEGFVSAEYDPIGRPEAFDKQITVYNNVTAQPIVLEIKGDVVPKTKEVSDIYRYKIGDIRLKTNHVAFARLFNTQTESQTVDIFNDSDKPITISTDPESLKEHISIVANPKTLQAKQSGSLTITYNAAKKNDWGYLIDRFQLVLNNKVAEGAALTVSATIVEDFSVLTPDQLANAPTMDFSSKEFDFGKIKQGEKVTHEFTFKNNGKTDLIIRETQTSCGCTAVENKKIIKSGESSSIKAVFNSEGKIGKQNKNITLITNIPGKEQSGVDKYKISLRITGEVSVESQNLEKTKK